MKATGLAESSILYFIFSLGSLCYSDIYRRESGRCHSSLFNTFYHLKVSKRLACHLLILCFTHLKVRDFHLPSSPLDMRAGTLGYSTALECSSPGTDIGGRDAMPLSSILNFTLPFGKDVVTEVAGNTWSGPETLPQLINMC